MGKGSAVSAAPPFFCARVVPVWAAAGSPNRGKRGSAPLFLCAQNPPPNPDKADIWGYFYPVHTVISVTVMRSLRPLRRLRRLQPTCAHGSRISGIIGLH